MKGAKLHMLSFKTPGSNGYNVAFGDGGNLEPWHLDVVEEWAKKMRKEMMNLDPADDGSDLV